MDMKWSKMSSRFQTGTRFVSLDDFRGREGILVGGSGEPQSTRP